MRLVSWNCNMKFREKYRNIIEKYNPDILIIPECEDPAQSKDEAYKTFAGTKGTDYFWTGDFKIKGLGLFIRNPDLKAQLLPFEDADHKFFIPVRINDVFNIVAVWTMAPYIREFYDYLQLNKTRIGKDTLIAGDFNSSPCFDKDNKGKSHTITVAELKQLGLESAYHYQTKEEHGKETKPTFYLTRSLDRPFHLDYCFLAPEKLEHIEIGAIEDWMMKGNKTGSDHLPLVVDFAE